MQTLKNTRTAFVAYCFLWGQKVLYQNWWAGKDQGYGTVARQTSCPDDQQRKAGKLLVFTTAYFPGKTNKQPNQNKKPQNSGEDK